MRTGRVLVCLFVAATFAVAAGQATALRPLETAIYEPAFAGGDAGLALDRSRSAGAGTVRIAVVWDSLVTGPKSPVDATNPADPAYRWTTLDEQVVRARERGLQPIVSFIGAPAWAQQARPTPYYGSVKPDPAALGKFALAAARRYSGDFENLPRVRYWQVWNEPNLVFYLRPQFERGQPFSPAWYRRMVNAFADAVHAVRRDNVVVAGGTAPFTSQTGARSLWGLGPLRFMRLMLCMGKDLKPACGARARFDVWAHHPYTSGGPTHEANLPDDVSLGDLPEMRRLLRAAQRSGKIVSRAPVRFWVTEFSWDSRPADPKGVPPALHARWVAEALYRMWLSDVSLVTWYTLRDQPFPGSPYQSGLYYRGATMERDRPKPALTAFRFPFVAFFRGGRVLVWGRTPTSRAGQVLVEQSFRGGWRRLGVVRAGGNGVFTARLAGASTGFVRARVVGTNERARPFSLKEPPDRIVRPFGT